MKLSSIIASLLLTAVSVGAMAATDRTYYVTELAPQQKFDVYNDGQNTYLQSVPGLIVSGATADGEFFIVKGVPTSIRGFLNGKPITVVRGMPPAIKPVTPDPAAVNERLKRLNDELAALSAKAQPARAVPAAAKAPASSAAPAPAAATAPTAPAGDVQARSAVTQHVDAAQRKATITDVMMWRVTQNDANMRELLDRWTKVVGWKTVWDVEKDVLLDGVDEKQTDFKSAVRRVLASTEFGDMKLKPCFYSNAVVRVVRQTTKCKPNE
jgi:hypothetical protein